jgi:hypothetical protein
MSKAPRRPRPDPPPVPYYDEQEGELWYRDHLVKSFQHPAPHQRTILATFQHAGWPRSIANPLGDAPERVQKETLHDTIKGLNHHQLGGQVLRFRGDGTGTRVRWEPVKRA